MTERLMLLDTASLYFRAFYGVPDTVRSPEGVPVNAARGLLDIIAKLVDLYRPTHLVACWDDDWRPAWRVERIPSYKAHRVAQLVPGGTDVEEVPGNLTVQVPLIRTELALLGIPVVGAAEHEADDVIGTLATDAGVPVDVVTGDRDLFQLVDDDAGVRVIYTARGMSKLEVVTDAVVTDKYGIRAAQYADYAVLRGDASDGLPGVAGIGEKTAAALLREFGSLDALIAAAATDEIPLSASVRAKLEAATDYLAVAPVVVEVVRDIRLEPVDSRIRPLTGDSLTAFERFSEENGLGGAAARVLTALASAAVDPA